MELSAEQFEQIAPLLPRQRGHVKIDNRLMLNAILYVAANGCKWRALPERFGKWQTVYRRMNRWAKQGVLDRIFEHLQRKRLIGVRIEALSLDSTTIKVHPDATNGDKKKGGRSPLGAAGAAAPPNFIWLPRMSVMSFPGA